MRILLDETLCDLSADSVGEAIAAVAALAERRGRMIVEVIVDGTTLTGEKLDSADFTTSSAGEVRLTSADPDELLGQTFQDASSALNDADRLQRAAAELLQTGAIPAAMERLGESISIWMSVQQALVMGLELADIDPADVVALPQADGSSTDRTPTTMNQMIEQLNGHLTQMREALEHKDTVALSDTLLYDLPAAVGQWQRLFNDLQSRITARRKES